MKPCVLAANATPAVPAAAKRAARKAQPPAPPPQQQQQPVDFHARGHGASTSSRTHDNQSTAAAGSSGMHGQRQRQQRQRQQSSSAARAAPMPPPSPFSHAARNSSAQPATAATGAATATPACSAALAISRTVPVKEQLRFERQGFLVTPGVLDETDWQQLREAVTAHADANKLNALRHRVRVLRPDIADPHTSIRTQAQALKALRTTDVGFLQFFNTHRVDRGKLREVVLSPLLGSMAAQLLGVKAVRVYQDCIFLKEPGFDVTNWHSDLRMTPFDTNSAVTAWIPMRAIQGDESDSGLLFAVGSHRDFALSFWHDPRSADLEGRYEVEHTGPMQPTDVSWHHGWCVHAAGPQLPGTPPRLALTVTFIADGTRLLSKSDAWHDEDKESYAGWLRDLKPGDVAAHDMLPLVWSGRSGKRASAGSTP